MKKIFLILIAVLMLLSFASCKKTDPDPGPGPDVKPLSNAKDFEDTAGGIRMQYPGEWLSITKANIDSQEVIDAIKKIGGDHSTVKGQLQSISAYFFALDMSDPGFNPNLYYLSAASSAYTQTNLQTDSMIASIKDEIDTQYHQAPFSNFKWVTEPTSKKLGDNYVVYFVIDYSLNNINVTTYQMITSNDKGKIYIFCFASGQGHLSNDRIELVEQILSTIKFI